MRNIIVVALLIGLISCGVIKHEIEPKGVIKVEPVEVTHTIVIDDETLAFYFQVKCEALLGIGATPEALSDCVQDNLDDFIDIVSELADG